MKIVLIQNIEMIPKYFKFALVLNVIFLLPFPTIAAKLIEFERDSMPIFEKEEIIEGIIFDDERGLPFSGATVYFKNSDLKIITNESGRFKFKIPDSIEVKGDRILIAESYGYISDMKNLDRFPQKGHINLFLHPKYPSVDFYTSEVYCGKQLTQRELRRVRWRRIKWKVRKFFR